MIIAAPDMRDILTGFGSKEATGLEPDEEHQEHEQRQVDGAEDIASSAAGCDAEFLGKDGAGAAVWVEQGERRYDPCGCGHDVHLFDAIISMISLVWRRSAEVSLCTTVMAGNDSSLAKRLCSFSTGRKISTSLRDIVF